MAVSVFIDTANITQHATPLRWNTEERTIEWGGRSFTAEVLSRGPRRDLPDWMEEQINCLPRISDLSRDGVIELYDGIESRLQSYPQFSSGISEMLGNPFAGIETRMVEDPLYEGRVVASAWGNDDDPFLDTDHDPTFSKLKANLGNDDAYHLLSAERAELDYFLTIDKKLCEAVRDHVTVELQVGVVLPCELLDAIK